MEQHNRFDLLAGTPVDIETWGYLWRRDRTVQEKAEAYFIPHRLKRIDEIYRVHKKVLGEEQTKAICYSNQPDIMDDFLPEPEHPLLTGLLWTGGITDYTVELVWPEGCETPREEDVDVRTYPTVWGWFGWTVDRRMNRKSVSENGTSWSYAPPQGLMIDHSYNSRVRAQTEMIAVFAPEGAPVPKIRVTGDSIGKWKKMSFYVEWEDTGKFSRWNGDFETHVAFASCDGRAGGIAHFTCLYSDVSRFGLDSKFTVINDRGKCEGATVLLRDLAVGPIYVPEEGLYFRPDGCEQDLREFAAAARQNGLKSIRDRTGSHAEPASWEETIEKVRLWRCPDGTSVPDFPDSPAPAVCISVPDKRWQRMYELAVDQLRGHHMWGFLGAEVFRVAAAMEMAGLHEFTDPIYDYFLDSPGVKPDADYSDSDGELEWAKAMRHDMAYAHEGCHTSTGGLIYAMMHRYFLTGDRQWFNERIPRLKKAADWIIRMIRGYMKDEAPNWEKLHVYGLMPPCFYGDYALPASDWHWYYHDNSAHQLGLRFFAEALKDIGDPDAGRYLAEAAQYEKDLIAAVSRESLFAPVRRCSDGFSRRFIPRMAYGGGLLQYGKETNIPQFAGGISDLFQGALPLACVGGVIDPCDGRIAGTVDAMEEGGLKMNPEALRHFEHPTATDEDKEAARRLEELSAGSVRTKTPLSDDLWFWNTFSNLPKLAFNANIYLREDDIPSFLRFFLNHAVVMVGSNGKLWEHAHPDIYVECENPDNGTAGWFVELFRLMLVMEDGDDLWITRGVPRSWLRQGRETAVEKAPTFYGDLSFRIVSDVDNGAVYAHINVPSRKKIPAIKIRFRHPDGKKIKEAVSNAAAAEILPDGETVKIPSPEGEIELTVRF